MAPPRWAFQLDTFEPPPDEELICSICRGVFYHPVQCLCDHVFCRPCIIAWLEQNSNCPVCREPATVGCLQNVVPLVNNMIMKLILGCNNAQNGCESKVMLENFEKHIKECSYEIVKCQNKKCRHLILRKEIGEHEKVCSYRYVKCRTCNLNVAAKFLKKHNCVRRLQGIVRKKQDIIKQKKKEIQHLKAEIDSLKASKLKLSRANTSSFDSFDSFELGLRKILNSESSDSNVFSENSLDSEDDRSADDFASASGQQAVPEPPLSNLIHGLPPREVRAWLLNAHSYHLEDSSSSSSDSFSMPQQHLDSSDSDFNLSSPGEHETYTTDNGSIIFMPMELVASSTDDDSLHQLTISSSTSVSTESNLETIYRDLFTGEFDEEEDNDWML